MRLRHHLSSGAVLRYRQGFGFYTVREGKDSPVAESEGVAALKSGLVRPEGNGQPDKFGVFHFTLSGARA